MEHSEVADAVTHAGPLREGERPDVTWRAAGVALATLVQDSRDADPALATTAGTSRLLTFAVGSLRIEAQVVPAPPGRRLVGRLVPPAQVEVTLTAGEVGAESTGTSTRSDAAGRFVLGLPPGRPLAGLRCTFADGSAIETARVRF